MGVRQFEQMSFELWDRIFLEVVRFGLAFPHGVSVKNKMCAELFGLEMFIESFNLQRRHGGTSAPPFTCKSWKV